MCAKQRLVLEEASAQPREASVKDVKRIMDSTVVLDVTFHRPGIYRKADISKVATEADKQMLRLNKDIVSRKEYAAAISVTNEARRWLDTRCLPCPLGRGTYLVPIVNIGAVCDKLEEVEQRYKEKFDEFLRVYPSLVEDARRRLKDQFDPKNYPSVESMRRAVYIERRFLDFGVPSETKIGRELWKEEKQRAETMWKGAAEEIQFALREAFCKLVAFLAEKLEPAPDGGRKTFKDTAVTKLLEFIDLFQGRNITNDAELEGLVIQARNVLQGKDPETLRNSSRARNAVYAEMTKAQQALDLLLETAPRRAISFDD